MRASADLEVLHREAAARLAADHQRYTRQRRVIVEALATIAQPATIGELVERTTDLPTSSAYRNLTVLEDVGVVRHVAGADEFGRFELSEALSHHHHHIVCASCGLVIDVSATPRLERALEDAAQAIAAEADFAITEHRLELVGVLRVLSLVVN